MTSASNGSALISNSTSHSTPSVRLMVEKRDRPDIAARRFVAIGGSLAVILGLLGWATGVSTRPPPTECHVFPQPLILASHVNAMMRLHGSTSCSLTLK